MKGLFFPPRRRWSEIETLALYERHAESLLTQPETTVSSGMGDTLHIDHAFYCLPMPTAMP